MSEKHTDYLLLTHYKEVFNHTYHTEANNKLFGSLIPDGWDIINNNLLIIENKKSSKQLNEAKQQIKTYYNNLPDEYKKYNVYLIIGLGNTEKVFKIYIYNSSFKIISNTLNEIKK